jgi:hypothetical protein
MAYAIGKLNEGLHSLYDRTRSELSALSSPAHALSAYTPTKAFQADVDRLIMILDKSRKVEVDPFGLRNVVASFDESRVAELLQKRVEALVVGGLGSQVCILSL